MPSIHSAFRKGCSRATALTKITDDILREANAEKVTFVILAIPKLFLAKLHYYLVVDTVLRWFKSHFIERWQAVRLGGIILTETETICGVPQGIILRPLSYSAYSRFFECLWLMSDACTADDIHFTNRVSLVIRNAWELKLVPVLNKSPSSRKMHLK